jgi:drug/metabolite transporter (DMT)-like permease
MTSTIVLCFIAGVLAANATPHFVKGITKEQFPTPFSAAPLPNLVGGWAMYVAAALILLPAHVNEHPLAALMAGALGVLLMGIFHARIGAFGKKPADSAALAARSTRAR